MSPAQSIYHILTAIRSEEDFWPLLNVGYALAKARSGRLTIVIVRRFEKIRPDWCQIPTAMADLPIEVLVAQSEDTAEVIVDTTEALAPDLLVMGWRGQQPKRGFALGSTLDHVVHTVRCNWLVIKAVSTWPGYDLVDGKGLKVLAPTAGGPNTPLALDLAFDLAADKPVTALYVLPKTANQADLYERKTWLAEFTAPWQHQANLETKVIQGDDAIKAISVESSGYNVTMVGATNESMFNQLLFGVFPHRLALKNSGATIIAQRFDSHLSAAIRRFWWRSTHFLPRLTAEERVEVYKQIRRGARPKFDFFMMIGLATGIAALGLLLDSPAVIIGAMLVAPLMSAIIGIGLATIQADGRLMLLALQATARGVALAVGVGLVIGLLLKPFSQPTSEILGRTAPNLFDLGVALVSGVAGAYAICRKNMSASLPGVAIAVALVPPLATVGIGLAWFEWFIARGAFILFLTNLAAITAASGFIFFLLGFRPRLERLGGTSIFSGGVIASMVMLGLMAWTLWSLSIDTFRSTERQDAIEQAVQRAVGQLGPGVRLIDWQVKTAEELRQEASLTGQDEEGEAIEASGLASTPELDSKTLALEIEVRAPTVFSYRTVSALRERIFSELQARGVLQADDPLALDLVVIRTTSLNPAIPPTSTPTPTDTATPTPGPTPTPTNTPWPSLTPSPSPTLSPTQTSTPPVTVTATPTLPPTSTFTPTPAPAVVANTEGRGIRLRWTPGGPISGTLPEGTMLFVSRQRETDADGVEWVRVDLEDGRFGWVAAAYLVFLR
ncbi:MAG TPA: DUF389 domain-containing protein [Anaerolineae bacterium]|nr:DUF389 domain-containing protein [Anaerolineae bacterium]